MKILLTTITILLLAIGVGMTFYIKSGNLTSSEKIGHWISLWGLVAAFISATFVISSYWQTNKAFVESQKPTLLIGVIAGNPTTEIHYVNITGNAFEDLTISMNIKIKERVIKLNNLFKENMYMAARDSHIYPFNTKDILSKHGIDLEKEFGENNDIILDVSYSFTFLGKFIKIDVQEYRLDPTTRLWNIL